MDRGIRRTVVIAGVIASLLLGIVSIRFAADMTAAAAPPPAPPVSLGSLKSALDAEQARGAALRTQLDELLSVTEQLTAALAATEGEVKTDGLTAKQLRARLKAADAKLKSVNRLLKEAQRRLVALGAAPVKAPEARERGWRKRRQWQWGRRQWLHEPDAEASADGRIDRIHPVAGPGLRRRPRELDHVLGQWLRQLRARALDRQRDPLPAGGPRHAGGADRQPGDAVHQRFAPIRIDLVPPLLPDEAGRRDEGRRDHVDREDQRPVRKTTSSDPDRLAPSRPATPEPKRPYHVGVAIGVTTGAYALSLLATSTLQIQQDRALIADRHPVDAAIMVLGDDHDQMEMRLQRARTRYGDGAEGYGALVARLDKLRERLAKMDKTVTSIERANNVLAASIPGVPATARSSTRGSTGGGAAAGPGRVRRGRFQALLQRPPRPRRAARPVHPAHPDRGRRRLAPGYLRRWPMPW